MLNKSGLRVGWMDFMVVERDKGVKGGGNLYLSVQGRKEGNGNGRKVADIDGLRARRW